MLRGCYDSLGKLTRIALVVFLLISFLITATVGVAYCTDPTRVTFSHSKTSSWADNRASEGYDIEWDLSITGEVTFPVDLSVNNTNTIYPNDSDEVSCEVTTPENEGSIIITVTGSIDVTTEVRRVTRTGHKEVYETKTFPITTPLGEREIPLGEILIPVAIPTTPPIPVNIILKPTLHLSSSIVASASVEGPATISQNNLEWISDGYLEIITVYSSSEAQEGDIITLTIKDINYNWDSWIIVGVYLEVPSIIPEKHVVDSPQLNYQTRNIASDGNVAVPFNIPVIPEFSPISISLIFIAITLVVTLIKKKLKYLRIS